jgi:hypothetical protein
MPRHPYSRGLYLFFRHQVHGVENLKEDQGKAIPLDHEDKKGFSESIKFLAGPVKAAVDFMGVAEINLAGHAAAERVQPKNTRGPA